MEAVNNYYAQKLLLFPALHRLGKLKFDTKLKGFSYEFGIIKYWKDQVNMIKNWSLLRLIPSHFD